MLTDKFKPLMSFSDHRGYVRSNRSKDKFAIGRCEFSKNDLRIYVTEPSAGIIVTGPDWHNEVVFTVEDFNEFLNAFAKKIKEN